MKLYRKEEKSNTYSTQEKYTKTRSEYFLKKKKVVQATTTKKL